MKIRRLSLGWFMMRHQETVVSYMPTAANSSSTAVTNCHMHHANHLPLTGGAEARRGRLQPVLMQPTPQLSFKTWGGVQPGVGGGGVFLPGVGGGVWPGLRGASSQG